jgi:hypothetical protein
MCSKEPHYFAFDLPNYRTVREWDEYQALFRDAPTSVPAVGESSVYYLYSNVAIERLYQRFPTARIIVMLRNPFDLAVSLHAQALRSRNESVTSFARAWALCGARRAGRNIPKGCSNVRTILYDRVPLLGAQLQRLLNIYPSEQVLWIFFEDFVKNTRQTYLDVLRFLDVTDDGRMDFPRYNPRLRNRSQIIARFTQRTPMPVVLAAKGIKHVLGIEQLGVIDRLKRLNWSPADKTLLTTALTLEMREVFEPDIRQLERLTGRNLEHWMRDAASSAH